MCKLSCSGIGIVAPVYEEKLVKQNASGMQQILVCEMSLLCMGYLLLLVFEERSCSRAVSKCITMVAFEVHRMADISRCQLVSACRTLGVKLGDVKSKTTVTAPFPDGCLCCCVVLIHTYIHTYIYMIHGFVG